MSDNLTNGIDVSHYNGVVDWARVAKAGIAFAYAKATEGAVHQDTEFTNNYAGIGQNAILRGLYHFFRPSVDAQAQATNFLKSLPQLVVGDLPPALDVEVSDGQGAQVIVSGIQQWLNHVEATLGCTPVIYTSASFWNANFAGNTTFSRYPLWVAHYTHNPAPNLPAGFADFTLWQYSESGQVPGITGSVDMNRFNGTSDDLRQFAVH